MTAGILKSFFFFFGIIEFCNRGLGKHNMLGEISGMILNHSC